MGKGKYLASDVIDKIISDHFLFGKRVNAIAKECDCSESSVSAVISTFSLLRDGRISEMASKIRSGNTVSDRMVSALAARIGMDLPAEIRQAMDERNAARMARRSARLVTAAHAKTVNFGSQAATVNAIRISPPIEEPQEEPQEEPAAPIEIPVVQDASAHNERVYFCRILEELHEQNELLQQLLDVVIPKYVADLKDNINANCDASRQVMQPMAQAVDQIRCNTRKRGM